MPLTASLKANASWNMNDSASIADGQTLMQSPVVPHQALSNIQSLQG